MKIITTPMCKEILDIAGIKEYKIVKPTDIKNADIAIILSETKSDIPSIRLKLNTYNQIYNSIIKLHNKFNTKINEEAINKIKTLIDDNKNKIDSRKDIKVKVYTKFLNDIVEDMGFTIVNKNYKYIVIPDYMKDDIKNNNKISIPSHKNVSKHAIQRAQNRYEILEEKLCMKP